jgi:sialate O-acetylesterase
VAGVVWYQGESNAGNPAPYATLLRRLIGSWRQLWQQAELPVVVVQLANYMAPSAQPQQSSWALLREAQRTVARELPAVELATAIDLGETVDIHPLRKQELATRIGDAFARMVYRDKRAPLSPQPTAATAQGSTVTLAFAEALEEGSLNEFELAGADGKYHNAVATAKGSTVTVTADGVEKPCFVRHAWKDNPINLNARAAKSGLPVTPFQLQVGQ